MTISRSQMNRQLYQSGGITSIKMEETEFDPREAVNGLTQQLIKEGVEPREAMITAIRMIEMVRDNGVEIFEDEERIEKALGGIVERQEYGFGSIVKSVSKAVKGVVKGVSSAAKGVVKAVKNVATSDFGKAALAAAALYFGGPMLVGKAATVGPGAYGTTATQGLFGTGGVFAPTKGKLLSSIADTFGKKATTEATKKAGSSLFSKGKVAAGILGLSGLAGASVKDQPGYDSEARKKRVGEYISTYGPNVGIEDPRFYQTEGVAYPQFLAEGGFMGGEPKNKGGIMEIDYRKAGGFVPIGVKEKADDVPAMLSKNEFVMTADAVRGAGNGNINKGAQRMYDTMKKLEAKVNG